MDLSPGGGGFTRVEGRKKPSAGPGALSSRRHASARVAEAAAAVAAEAVLAPLRGRRGGLAPGADGGLELMARRLLIVQLLPAICFVVEHRLQCWGRWSTSNAAGGAGSRCTGVKKRAAARSSLNSWRPRWLFVCGSA